MDQKHKAVFLKPYDSFVSIDHIHVSFFQGVLSPFRSLTDMFTMKENRCCEKMDLECPENLEHGFRMFRKWIWNVMRVRK